MIKRIYRLLLKEERKGLFAAMGRMFVCVLLDFAGLASLLPVLYYLLEKGEKGETALFFSLLAIGMVLIKYSVTLLISKRQNRYLIGLYKRLSFDLYTTFFRKGLLFIRQKGVNRLSYEVNAICYSFSLRLLNPLIRIMSDSLLVIVAILFLLFYDAKTALVLMVSFLPFTLVYLRIVQKNVEKYGKRESNAKREQQHLTMETFEGYAEVQVNDAQKMLFKSFQNQLDEIGENQLHLVPYTYIPLLLSELSVVGGLIVLVVLGTENIKMWIGLFAVAAFRLLPAVRSILSGWTQIKSASVCLEVLEQGLLEKDYELSPERTYSSPQKNTIFLEKDHVLSFERTLSFSNISYTYPNGDKVFDNFSIQIQKGEYMGIKGYSGVGKSTLFNLLLGFLIPDKGEIRIDDTPLTPSLREEWLKQVGYVPQEVFIFAGTVAENIALGCEKMDKQRVESLLQKVALSSWIKTLPNGMDTLLGDKGSNLSGGQKQRIGIARAMYRDIDLLLLDESTSALDNPTEEEIHQSIHDLRRENPTLTILSIAHRESSLKYCDRIIQI